MSAAREYLLVLAALVVGAVACIVLPGATWARAEVAGVLGTDQVRIAGSELVPLAEAAGWLGLAAVVAVHAARGPGRVVVGALVATAGLAVAVWAGWRAANLDTAAEVAATGETVPTVISTTPALAVGTAAGGALVAAAGVLTVVRGSRWPSMGRKYERPDQAGAGGTTTARDAGSSAARDASGSAARDASGSAARDAWNALDRGDDPTTWLRDAKGTRQNETDATNGSGRRARP